MMARAASLLAVVAVVLALMQAGQVAVAGVLPLQVAHDVVAHHAAQTDDACDHHAALHAAHHAALKTLEHEADAGTVSASDESHGFAPDDPALPHHTHPCCVSAVTIVLPAVAAMQIPAPTGGHRVVGDVAERLERRAPEGPNEPPRTADMG